MIHYLVTPFSSLLLFHVSKSYSSIHTDYNWSKMKLLSVSKAFNIWNLCRSIPVLSPYGVFTLPDTDTNKEIDKNGLLEM